jgi:hypothetical protein
MWRRLVCALAVAAAVAVPVRAQPPPVLFAPEPRPGFLSRLTMLGSVEVVTEPGATFDWDADVAIGLDIVDFIHGRAHVFFGYEAVLGSELQPFDPRQGNYFIETLGALRRGNTEVGVKFRHVSRHLGDRAKDFGIAWNDLGIELRRIDRHGPWLSQVRAHAAATVARGFVDYLGDAGGEAIAHRHVSRRVAIIGSLVGHARLVRRSDLNRGTQAGGRAEIGMRLRGEAAAIEIVAGAERRVDADPFEFRPRAWLFAGLRVVTP